MCSSDLYCDVIRCTDDEAIRVNVADNRLSDIAGNDPDELVQLLSYLDDDYEGSGWNAEEVQRLIEPGPPGGDAPADDLPVSWGVIVECSDEDQQVSMLRQLSGEGWKVRALMT